MMKKLTHIQRELRIVQRASWLMGLLAVLAVVPLIDPAILVQNFSYNMQRFIINFVLALFMGLLISLVAFVGFGMVLREWFCAKSYTVNAKNAASSSCGSWPPALTSRRKSWGGVG